MTSVEKSFLIKTFGQKGRIITNEEIRLLEGEIFLNRIDIEECPSIVQLKLRFGNML